MEWRVFQKRAQGSAEQGELILDGHSGLEVTLGVVGALLFLLSLTLGLISLNSRWPPPSVFIAGAVSGVLILYLRILLDDRYRLDLKTRKVEFQRTIAGWKRRSPIGGFSDLACVAVSSGQRSTKYTSYWVYGLSLVLKNGTLVPVLPPESSDHASAGEVAADLAKLLQVSVHRGKPEQLLTVGDGPLGSKVTYKPYVANNLAVFCLLIVIGVVPLAIAFAIAPV